ncbi:hypothetical protein Tco_1415468 [Tanacetum coccineum]
MGLMIQTVFDSIMSKFELSRVNVAYMLKNPAVKVVSVGIGDTIEPIREAITYAMDEQLLDSLRRQVSSSTSTTDFEVALEEADLV